MSNHKVCILLPGLGTHSPFYEHINLQACGYSFEKRFSKSSPAFFENFAVSISTGGSLVEHGLFSPVVFDNEHKIVCIPQAKDVRMKHLWEAIPATNSDSWVLNWPASLTFQELSTLVISKEFVSPTGTRESNWPVLPYSVSKREYLPHLLKLRAHPKDFIWSDFEELKCFKTIKLNEAALKCFLVMFSEITTIQSMAMYLLNKYEKSTGYMVFPVYEHILKILSVIDNEKDRELCARELGFVAKTFLHNLLTSEDREFLVVGDGEGDQIIASNSCFVASKHQLSDVINYPEDLFGTLSDFFYGTIFNRVEKSGVTNEPNSQEFLTISEFYRGRKQNTLSLDYLNKAVQIAPDNKIAQFRLLQTLLELGDISGAQSKVNEFENKSNSKLTSFFNVLIQFIDSGEISSELDAYIADMPKFLQFQLLSICFSQSASANFPVILKALLPHFKDASIRALLLSYSLTELKDVNELESLISEMEVGTLKKKIQELALNWLLSKHMLSELGRFL